MRLDFYTISHVNAFDLLFTILPVWHLRLFSPDLQPEWNVNWNWIFTTIHPLCIYP